MVLEVDGDKEGEEAEWLEDEGWGWEDEGEVVVLFLVDSDWSSWGWWAGTWLELELESSGTPTPWIWMADLTSSKEDIENFKLKNLMNEFNQSNLSRIAPEVEMIGLG